MDRANGSVLVSEAFWVGKTGLPESRILNPFQPVTGLPSYSAVKGGTKTDSLKSSLARTSRLASDRIDMAEMPKKTRAKRCQF
jgi:hypothetical protein